MAQRRPLVRVGGKTSQLPTGDTLPKSALPTLTAADVGAAAADDARLTNAREWTASTVSQAEAEAGTASTRRAWTAQRVRQAVAAWWAALTVDASKITTGTFAAARIPTLNQNTTGNAATATKLATARTINGVAFDGSANITLGIDWSNVANKPSTYAPSAHSHAQSDITGLTAALAGKEPAITAHGAPGVYWDGTKQWRSLTNGLIYAQVQVAAGTDTPIQSGDFLEDALGDLQAQVSNRVVKVAGKGLSTEDYTSAEKSKLGGIATGATANDTDGNLKNRANHTGAQAISTVTGLQAALDGKLSGDPKQLCTAWVNFNGTGTVAIRDSYNVSSVTDNGTGRYTVNFETPMDDSNYSVVAGGNVSESTVSTHQQSVKSMGYTTSKLDLSISASSYIDWELVTAAVFGGKN